MTGGMTPKNGSSRVQESDGDPVGASMKEASLAASHTRGVSLDEALAQGRQKVIADGAAYLAENFPGMNISHIGGGSEGECYHVVNPTDNKTQFCAKVRLLSSTFGNKNRYERELDLAKSLEHTGLCKGYDQPSIDSQRSLIVTYFEYAPGISFDKLAASKRGTSIVPTPCLSLSELRPILEQVLRTLEYLHLQNVLHRDIKPGNLVWDSDNNSVKLIDLGTATEPNPTATALFTQPNAYMDANAQMLRHNTGSDLYALGVTLLELLQGEIPEKLINPSTRGQKYTIPQTAKIQHKPGDELQVMPQALRDFLQKLLDGRFPSASNALSELKSIWPEYGLLTLAGGDTSQPTSAPHIDPERDSVVTTKTGDLSPEGLASLIAELPLELASGNVLECIQTENHLKVLFPAGLLPDQFLKPGHLDIFEITEPAQLQRLLFRLAGNQAPTLLNQPSWSDLLNLYREIFPADKIHAQLEELKELAESYNWHKTNALVDVVPPDFDDISGVKRVVDIAQKHLALEISALKPEASSRFTEPEISDIELSWSLSQKKASSNNPPPAAGWCPASIELAKLLRDAVLSWAVLQRYSELRSLLADTVPLYTTNTPTDPAAQQEYIASRIARRQEQAVATNASLKALRDYSFKFACVTEYKCRHLWPDDPICILRLAVAICITNKDGKDALLRFKIESLSRSEKEELQLLDFNSRQINRQKVYTSLADLQVDVEKMRGHGILLSEITIHPEYHNLWSLLEKFQGVPSSAGSDWYSPFESAERSYKLKQESIELWKAHSFSYRTQWTKGEVDTVSVQELSDLFGLPDYWTVSPFFPLNPNSIRVDDAGKVFIPEDPSDLSKGERCIARLIHIEEKTYALPPTEQPWSDTGGICKKATSFIKDLFRSKDDKGLRKEGLHYISTALEAYSCKAYYQENWTLKEKTFRFGCTNVISRIKFEGAIYPYFSATIFLCADGKLRVIDSNYHAYVLNEFTIKIFPHKGKIGSHGVLHAPSIKLPLCRASEAPFLNDSDFLPEYLLPSHLQKKPETP